MPSEWASCLSSALFTVLLDLRVFGQVVIMLLYMGFLSRSHTRYLTERMHIQESLLCIFHSHHLSDYSLCCFVLQPGSSLEQTHIFVLAHILRRPIIVYGVKYYKSFRGETLGYTRFQGERWSPAHRCFSQILLKCGTILASEEGWDLFLWDCSGLRLHSWHNCPSDL